MPTISFEELDGLTGELLPERSVLSTMLPLGGGDGVGVGAADSNSSSAAVAEGGDAAPRGVISTSACQAVNNMGTPPSLVSGSPFGGLYPNSSFTCMPGTTAVY
ncbi:hypothetical protein [Streptomyces yerevanensis]|uniref:hypothetical protein n=1 Tax=Streptomyces yerevanensis TaxID=66378 RepID=UPI0005259E04|nr:hypothetical protein [Streptomyces yerevanensis]